MSQLPIAVTKLISATALVGSLICVGTAGGALAKSVAPAGHTFSGYSHHYHDRFHGRRTASGQAHDKFKLTAAHRTLPFGTHLQVTNTRSGKSCVVVVNDRGPFGSQNLVLDVSKAAAHKLGFPGGGKIPIICKVIDPKAAATALKDSEKDCEAIVAKIAASDSKKNLIEASKPKQEQNQSQEKLVAKLPVPQVKSAAESKPQAKIQIASKPAAALLPATISHTTDKTSRVKSTDTEAVHETPTHGTFLLVINEALESEHSLKTAEFNPANNHHARSPYAPTVFMKVDDAASGKNADKKHAPAIADNKLLM